MSYRYQIKAGHEHKIFGGDGVRNLGDGFVESDEELESVLLKLVEEKAAEDAKAQLPAPASQPAAQLPPANPNPTPPPLPPNANQGGTT